MNRVRTRIQKSGTGWQISLRRPMAGEITLSKVYGRKTDAALAAQALRSRLVGY